MAGHKDLGLRARVRKFLKKKGKWALPDREIARECECSRATVKAVRMELLALGLFAGVDKQLRHRLDVTPRYTPGAVSRGGYVYGLNGENVRIDKWQQMLDADPELRRLYGEPSPPDLPA